MQTNDSRLIKAAKRTVRAEATLVIVILVIASWSVYALYKLSIGASESIFGFSLYSAKNSNSEQEINSNSSTPRTVLNSIQDDGRTIIYSQQQPTNEQQQFALTQNFKNQIIQEILAKRKELFGSIGVPPMSHQSHTTQDSSYQSNLLPASALYGSQRMNLTSPPNQEQPLQYKQQPGSLMANDLMIQRQQHQMQYNDKANLWPINQYAGRADSPRTPVPNLPSLMQLNPNLRPQKKRLDLVENSEEREPTEEVIKLRDEESLNDRDVAESGSVYKDEQPSRDTDYIPSPINLDESPSLDSQTADSNNNSSDNEPESSGENSLDDRQDPGGDSGQEDSSSSPAESEADSASNISDSDQTNNQSSSMTPEEVEKLEDDSLKETGHMIDEEVDRMTQPSVSDIQQEFGQGGKRAKFDYKNTVQFDDSLSGGSQVHPNPVKKFVEPGNVVARFVEPNSSTEANENSKRGEKISLQPTNGGNSASQNNSSPALNSADLQFDHNKLSISSNIGRNKSRNVSNVENNSDFQKKLIGETPINRRKFRNSKGENKTSLVGEKSLLDALVKRSPMAGQRQRRSPELKVGKISEPNQIDKFLNLLDFDDLIGQQSNLKPDKQPTPESPIRSTGGKNATESLRRSDLDGEAEEEGEEGNGENEDDDNQEHPGDSGGQNDDGRKRALHHESPRYHYLSSNDSDLKSLLAEKQLLDALSQSRLPAPSFQSNSINHPLQRNLSLAPGSGGVHSTVSKSIEDPQTASSLYTVDHGLLLYPSVGSGQEDYEDEGGYEEHSKAKHKMMSKKKKKHGKSKKKKKMTVAMKKGGHKKKKHKKMEKKYLKEKKFKGAKKGKKMSKGKGGQGGKKGKKLYKDKGFKKKGFKNVYHKEEFGQKKSYFDEYRDKDFKKKWKKFDDKYNYAQMKKWQAKDVKGAKKMKDHGEKFKKYDKSKWKKKYQKHYKEHSAKEMMKKKKKHKEF